MELGLTLPAGAVPVGSYVSAVVDGDMVWTSGQLPMVEGQLMATGLVGGGEGDVSPDVAHQCAQVAALNALAAIAAVAGGLDRIERILRVVGYVASTPGFTAQPSVVNGASDLLVAVFGENGRHARSAVGVASLPLDAPVEIEIQARLRP
jgi:enamine deaminase RidA (YjgF/YER057c/UK114 family)